MSINPTIALQGQPIQPVSPMASLQRAMTLRSMLDSQKMRELQTRMWEQDMEQQQRTMDDDAALRKVTSQYAGLDKDGVPDIDAVAGELDRTGHPAAAAHVRKTAEEHREATQKRLSAQLDASKRALDQVGALLQGVQDDAGYQRVLPTIQSLIRPELAAKLPAVYDPTTKPVIDQAITWGQSASEHASAVKDATERLKDLPKTLEGASQLFSLAKSAEDWGNARKLLKLYGFKDDVLDMFGPYSSTAAQEAALRGMTPADRQAARDRKRTADIAESRERRLGEEGPAEPRGAVRQREEAEKRRQKIEDDKANAYQDLEAEFEKLRGTDTGTLSDAQERRLEARKLLIENDYRRRIGLAPAKTLDEAYGKAASATTETPKAAPKATATAPAAPAAAGKGQKKPMTRARAADIIRGQTGKPATKAQIDWFVTKYPFDE